MKVYILTETTSIRDVEKIDIIDVFETYKSASDAHEMISPETRYRFFIEEYEVKE